MEKKHAVCMLCAKPSSKAICDVCADHLRGEALDKKKKDEKIRE
jgi:recombinational DNA repair protein RecR